MASYPPLVQGEATPALNKGRKKNVRKKETQKGKRRRTVSMSSQSELTAKRFHWFRRPHLNCTECGDEKGS